MSGQKSLNSRILSLAWPAIATNVTTPLLSLVDIAVVGHIGKASYIGAVAVGGAMFNMLYWLFGFLRASTSGLTANAYGASDQGEQLRILVRSMVIAVLAGLLMVALAYPLGDTVLRFIDSDPETETLARRYFNVAIWGAPGVLGTYVLSGWFLGMQSSKPTMWMALVANTANIILSLIFVFYLGMGIVGVGLGTAIAQWISLSVGLVFLIPKVKPLLVRRWYDTMLSRVKIMHTVSMNADIMLRTICLIAVTLWFTHAGAQTGQEILAANALLMQLFMLFSYFMDGFAYAGEALAGRFAGEEDRNSLIRLARRLMVWGAYLAVFCSALYLIGGKWFLSLLTDDDNVVAIATDYRLWAVAVPLAGFLSFLWDGVYIGLTRTRLLLVTMCAAMVVFFAAYYLCHPAFGNHGLWLAFILYLLTRGLLQTFLFGRAIRHVAR